MKQNKMVNKNPEYSPSLEFLMTYGWAILALIIAIGVLTHFLISGLDNGEIHYGIYREECENNTHLGLTFAGYREVRCNKTIEEISPQGIRCLFKGEMDNYTCEAEVCVFIENSPYDLYQEDLTIIRNQEAYFRFKDYDIIDTTRLDCNLIEVDEIRYDIESIKGTYCDINFYPEHKQWCDNRSEEYINYVTISKQDLTIEWLEEFCGCLNCESLEKRNKDGKLLWLENTDRGMVCKVGFCSEYKCPGNYTVETWEQIK